MSLSRFFKHSQLKVSFLSLLWLMIYGSAIAQEPLKLVFPWDGNVYMMDTETGDTPSRILEAVGAYETHWSPDGSKILYVGDDGIHIVNADGTGLTRLSTDNSVLDGHPDWSPDGSKIVFMSDRDSGDLEIFVMDTNGQNVVNLTRHSGRDAFPSWSPDGNRIVFATERNGEPYKLYIMNADGSNPIRLTNLPGNNYDPVWSPTGDAIVFQSLSDDRDCPQVYMIRADGTALTSISEGVCELGAITWLPDGSKALYQEHSAIYVSNLDGTDTTSFFTLPHYGEPINFFDIYPALVPTPAVTLRSIFNPPSCAVACWLGIEPGVTTQKQVQEILAGLGIEYTVNPVSFPPVGTGEENGLYNFNVTSMPFINSQGFVAVHFADGIAGMIQIPVVIPSSMILQEYGSPYAAILEDKSSLSIVYPEYRMSFSTSIETIQSYFYYLEIGTERTVSNYFLSIDSFSAFVEDCETVPGSCLFATATPSG